MRMRWMSRWALSVVGLVAIASTAVDAAPFIPGDLAVYQVGPLVPNGTLTNSATPINIIELSPTVAAQATPVQTISISTQASPLYTSGTASSTGILRNSTGNLLTFTGHTVPAATGTNENTITARGVGTLDMAGNYNLATTYTGISGNQTRSAITANGSDYYIGDQGGVYGNGNIAPEFAGNVRSLGYFGGQTYALQQSSTATTIVVSSLSPSQPQNSGPVTLTGLPGLSNSSTAQDFYMLSSGTQGATIDTLYITTTTGVAKFSLEGGTWTARGTAGVAGGAYGIAAQPDGTGGVELYLTTGNGTGTSVVALDDLAGFNSNFNAGTTTTLYTVPAGTTATLRGIALVPEPAGMGLMLLAVGMLGRRRIRRAGR
jgi:trimeric autotransporter adhesin